MTQSANLAALGSNAGTTGILAATGGGTAGTAGVTGFKNRIINGAMVIDQRNAGASGTATGGAFPVDRFGIYANYTSAVTWQQNLNAVTPPAGFNKYLGVTATASKTLGASERIIVYQNIEGLNVADLGWGTANAKTVTLSFQVYSSLTGTFGGSLVNSASDRSYPFSYSIPTANTWTTISVTIAGDTTGTWLTTNGIGITVQFSLGSGTSVSSTAGSWAAGYYSSATGSTSVVGTNGATFYITGVQLEVGTAATNFDVRSYGTELALCQRYFYKAVPTVTNGLYGYGYCQSTSDAGFNVQFPVTMRASPLFSYAGAFISQATSANGFPTALSLQVASNGAASVISTGASGLTTNAGARLLDRTDGSSSLSFSAEL